MQNLKDEYVEKSFPCMWHARDYIKFNNHVYLKRKLEY